jgi:folate-binding protein YgfZ
MPNTTQTELAAILHGAAIAPLETSAFLRITGADATRWLNGMVTNSIQSLAPGEGCYNFLLNAQGRILADCTVYREIDGDQPAFLLATGNWQLETVRTHLDHFIIMDDVELVPAHTDDTSLLLLGPDAPRLLASLRLPAPEPLRLARADTPHGSVLILTAFASAATSVPRFELYADTNTIANLQAELLTARAAEVSAGPLELLRILEGRPLIGRDIPNSETAKYLPQETNQPHALHFAKGCYLGQEIVERIRSRGQVHRLLTPLTLTGSLPTELPAPLHSPTDGNARSVGEITSAALIPLPEGPQLLALGYVRREALDTHQPLTYSGGSAAPRSVPSAPASNLTEPIHA